MQDIDKEIEATLGILSETESADLSDAVLDGIMARIESGEISSKDRPGSRTMTLAVAAVVLLAGLNLTFFLWPGTHGPDGSKEESSWIVQEYNLDPGSHMNLE